MRSDVLARILKDKKYLRDIDSNDLLSEIFEDYLEFKAEETLAPTAKQKENFIGLEIECFSNYDQLELYDRILECGLGNNVQVTTDASIDPDFGEDYELRVLFPEKELKPVLRKLKKLFNSKFGVNDSCGLHVHLDMRHRNAKKMYEKLMKFQDVLFALVDRERWDNTYCNYSNVEKLEQCAGRRYMAINGSAYDTHKTIEVRLHQGTLDVNLIEKWVTLLMKIMRDKSSVKVENQVEAFKWARKHRLGPYFKKCFKPEWFKGETIRQFNQMDIDW